jgi:DNA polymerase II large subunit
MFLEKIREEVCYVPANNLMGVRQVTRTVARCKCGEEILLSDPMDNDCDACGRIYNMSGQQVRCHARDVDYLDAGERW